MTVAGWVVALVAAAVVAGVCAVALLVIGLVGARRRASTGPLVVVGRAVFVVLLVAVLVALGSALWGLIGGALATLS